MKEEAGSSTGKRARRDGAPAALVVREDRELAGPVWEQLLEQIERLIDGLRVRERSEIARGAVAERARAKDAWEIFAQRDLHVGIGLVVLEPDVVARLVLLDEIRLEEVGLRDRAGHGEFHALGPLDQADVADVETRPEVRSDAVAEDVGLTDIKDTPTGVFEQVDAGRVRKGRDLGLEALAALVLVHAIRSSRYPFTW